VQVPKAAKKRKIDFDNESSPSSPNVSANFFAKRNKKLTQDDLNNLILNYVVSTLASFRSVEDPHFVKLITALHPELVVPKRKKIAGMVSEEVSLKILEIKEELKKLNHVSTAADLWSGGKRYSVFSEFLLELVDYPQKTFSP
jgi:hypothetical protein